MKNLTPLAQALNDALVSMSTPSTQKVVEYFFKTGKGEYGEGDRFLGIKVPAIRSTIKPYIKLLSPEDALPLVASEYHEIRMAGLLIWVAQFKAFKNTDEREKMVDLYLANTSYINNWDLVDLSCEYILGEYLLDKPHDVLFKLAESSNLWEQRIAIVSTLTFIRKGMFDTTILLCEKYLNHPHDLIHKASGWCLREVGKRNETVLRDFLEKHAHIMPRTMLRYSIEKMNEGDRHYFMEAKQRMIGKR